MYYNTTSMEGTELDEAKQKARSQRDRVYDFFRYFPGKEFTPSEVLENVFSGEHVPITSVRRCLTDLTKDARLMKIDRLKAGPYGATEHHWKLWSDKATPQQELF